MLKFLMRIMGNVYCYLEKFVKYPNDHTILGIPIDEDLQGMSRRELCEFIEKIHRPVGLMPKTHFGI